MLIIKELRNEKNETQSELADAIGVSLRTIQNYEANKGNIPNDILEKIAQHYEVTVSYLFGETNISLKNNRVNKELLKNAEYCMDNWDELMQLDKFKSHFYYRLTKTLNMDIDEIFSKVLKK